MSIVRSNGTLVNSDFTSNDTILCPAGMVIILLAE